MLRFIKEKGLNDVIENRPNHNISIENGFVAREIYENVLEMPSTSTSRMKSETRRTRRRFPLPFDKNTLFKAASCNDLETVERMNMNNRNINVIDQYGWSALMMAACDGHLDMVKFLIRRGAKLSITGKQNETAWTLAEQRKHDAIIEFLEQIQSQSNTICLDSDSDDDDSSNKSHGTFFCDICELEFSRTDKKSHEASTLHRFNRTDTQKPIRNFGLPESNVGFRMMLQQGWDRESGLGPDRDGIKYPIKTTMRKPRSGFGTRQSNTAKVTHFQPFDRDAVKYIKPPSIVKTKKRIRAEKRRNERKDRHLRKLLS